MVTGWFGAPPSEEKVKGEGKGKVRMLSTGTTCRIIIDAGAWKDIVQRQAGVAQRATRPQGVATELGQLECIEQRQAGRLLEERKIGMPGAAEVLLLVRLLHDLDRERLAGRGLRGRESASQDGPACAIDVRQLRSLQWNYKGHEGKN